jgi:hypothetical protein
VSKVKLDTELVGPETDEFNRIERAAAIVSDRVGTLVERRWLKLHWSWGDSNAWRVIIAIPTETQFSEFVASQSLADLAAEIVGVIGEVVELNDGFKFYLELDSDERVRSHEGWFFRLKSDPKPGREFVFAWNGENLVSA